MRWLIAAGIGAVVLPATLFELHTSHFQSIAITRYAAGIDHWLAAGPNPRAHYPERGPFDLRAGYSELRELLPRAERAGFAITAQARVSTRFEEAVERGIFPIYSEKTQIGLEILGRAGSAIFAYSYPERVLPSFESIPPLLVRSLLYIENRELLDAERPYRNPAVEWDRLAMMGLRFGRRSLGQDGSVQGASTLATQIEKFRHSPGGMTQTPAEKLRQMASASVRAYRGGRTTLQAQQQIVVDYLNGLPLAAQPSRGEIHGLADGLWMWYGIDSEDLALLREPIEHIPRAAVAYRAALCLILATRRPAYYLRLEGREDLERLCDSYLRLLEAQGVIPEPLGRAARGLRLERPQHERGHEGRGLFEHKAANAIRSDLLGLLGLDSLYQLDRLDLKVSTSIDDRAQTAVARELRALQDPTRRAAAGLTGPRLLPQRDALPITYSILLCEATPAGNLVRVQTDTFAGPRDVNRHSKLELGSTAKLRTLATYLEIVEALHAQLEGASPEVLASYGERHGDALTAWMVELLGSNPALSVEAALQAALERRYSANPAERFITGGGLHTFSNFDDAFDARAPTVQEAFRESVNLVFIRLMRDIVRYHEERIPFARNVADESSHPMRVTYLSRFAYQEGQQFLRRFHDKHFGIADPAMSVDALLGSGASSPLRAARTYLTVLPEASVTELGEFLRRSVQSPLGDDDVAVLHRRVSAESFSLADAAYLVGVHPLELWVAQHLAREPMASLPQTIAAADEALQEAYRWLFRTRRKELQDSRIRTVVEGEAFAAIHAGWRRLGYPFSFLVPSFATAIGSSGDSPEALAELVGIVVNDGVRRPMLHISELRFAEGTPFEAHLRRAEVGAERVLSVAVARSLKAAMADVVANGTGRRVRDAFLDEGGTPLLIGGKTGTGDNRHVVVDRRGERVASHSRNRTASLVFFVGNHFGVVTAHVDGPEAGDFEFTSALPAQLLHHVAPLLEPLLRHERVGPQAAPATPASHTF